MAINGVGASTQTAANSTVGMSINIPATNSPQTNGNCMAVTVVHMPSAGAQAVASISSTANNIRHIQTKTDTNFGGTVSLFAAYDMGPQQTSFGVSFDKTVNAAVIVRHQAGGARSPKFIQAVSWNRGTLTSSVATGTKYLTPRNFEQLTTLTIAERGSATPVLSNCFTALVADVVGMRVFEALNNRDVDNGVPEFTGISSTGWLALSFTINSDAFVDVSAAHGGEMSDERETHMKRMNEDSAPSVLPFVPQSDVPSNPGPSLMSYEEVMAIVRGKQ